MKSIRFLAIAFLTLAMLAACAPQETQNPTSVSDQSLPYCPMPIYFDSEEDLLRTINEVKSKKTQKMLLLLSSQIRRVINDTMQIAMILSWHQFQSSTNRRAC